VYQKIIYTEKNSPLTEYQCREAAGKQCKVSSTLFVLTADGRELDLTENMESANYFNAKHGLKMIGD
jgi:hypothetical protein